MVEVSPLPLFLTFFKSILNRTFCFGIISTCFYFSNPHVEASVREETPYLSEDIRVFLDSNQPTKLLRSRPTESIINLKVAP
ncbi:hypothetical protein [Fluviispira sanaruensis]|uniref:hypothetical protein n=1 Tax=Fluviispira sanaruensis TaxID=2493639 RepID=UPI00102E9918|nr:hypothetical protein [Fluviispira sanaruensis]